MAEFPTESLQNTFGLTEGNVSSSGSAVHLSAARRSPMIPILLGGGVAGALDLISAYITFGWRVPKGIAGGLLGPSARDGGVGVYILGVLLHFFIAVSAAALYYAASRKLRFLKENPLVCGLFFGVAVFLVMNLIVLPLSAYHSWSPIPRGAMIQGLLVHMFCIGLPISLSVWRFSD